MNLHYIKIGASVAVVALATYVFFPVDARQTTMSTTQSGVTSVTVAKKSKPTQATSVPKKSAQKSTAQAKSNEAQIEPEKTLRKQQSANRNGPPSKMYGGM